MGLLFDKYQARAQCFIGFLAALSVFERRLAAEDKSKFSLITYDTIKTAAHQVPTGIRVKGGEPRLLDAYFLEPGHARYAEFSGKNAEDVTPRMIKFVQGFLETHFFASQAPMALACDGALGTPFDQTLAKRIRQLAHGDDFKSAIKKARPEEVGRSSSVEAFLNQTLGPIDEDVRHPEFACFALFDLKALKIEFKGLEAVDDAAQPPSGLYAVVREPRGWAAQKADQINLLVRDILWLSPRKAKKDEKFRGFYASVVDQAAFVIDHLHVEDDIVTAHCVLKGKFPPTQRTRVVFSRFRDSRPLETRHGLVSGTAGDGGLPTFAAWKVLVVNTGWDDVGKLESLLYQLAEKEGELAFRVVAEAQALGVLDSAALRSREPTVAARRKIFRDMIASDRTILASDSDILNDFLSETLRGQLLAAMRTSRASTNGDNEENLAEAMISALSNYVRSQWHLIEPTQTIMFKESKNTPDQLSPENDVRAMITREHVGGKPDLGGFA